ncbi:hypothetical protein K491DRAFT_719495 [Lophiostoma macrostomum CBS 122681]|uniref:Uncharacterized protein n=1 Tax=Lophiostoma macrostomum CBS 122681 TaxID=1314788 RepID=A0A6A6SXQ0_9PLEO|nr:hypothetical protein K491DRAFT_719495 [Lophiostoma macrostomum CBS 122681]
MSPLPSYHTPPSPSASRSTNGHTAAAQSSIHLLASDSAHNAPPSTEPTSSQPPNEPTAVQNSSPDSASATTASTMQLYALQDRVLAAIREVMDTMNWHSNFQQDMQRMAQRILETKRHKAAFMGGPWS